MKLIKKLEGIVPVPKPRMTRRDSFTSRPCVVRYREYCDRLNELFSQDELPENYLLVFLMPMPKSWSKSKKQKNHLQPHRVRPDKDNLEKSFLDGLFSKYHSPQGKHDDSHVWDGRTIKLWDYQGAIAVYQVDSVLERLENSETEVR